MACRSGSLRVPTPGTSCTTVPRYDGWLVRAVGQRGGDDARLQAQRAQRVELVTRQHHDALRVGAHGGGARRVADLAIRRARVERGGIGCARFVGPALIAEHAGAGDLGGAGDDRLLAGRRRRASAERSAAARRASPTTAVSDGGRGGNEARPPPADQHVADGNIRAARSWSGANLGCRCAFTTVCRTHADTGPVREIGFGTKTAGMSRLDVWRTCW